MSRRKQQNPLHNKIFGEDATERRQMPLKEAEHNNNCEEVVDRNNHVQETLPERKRKFSVSIVESCESPQYLSCQLCPKEIKTAFTNSSSLSEHVDSHHRFLKQKYDANKLQIQDLVNSFNHLEYLKMTRRKSNNVVRHNGGIGSTPEEAVPPLPKQNENRTLPAEVAEEKPDGNLIMDLSHRDETDEAERVREEGHAEDGVDLDDNEDDAGIYGDMAEGDMVAAMLEEAQIPRSQFLGLNAEEKQRLLEARRTCRFCGKVCIKRSDLQRHLLVHTGERPWLCKLCNKSFKAKRSLLYHQRSAHGLEINDINGEPETKQTSIAFAEEKPTTETSSTSVSRDPPTSVPHEAFPSTTLHPQLWANLTKFGWPMNEKQEPFKAEPEQGLDLSASGSRQSHAPSNAMESLIRQQREQLLARAAMSTDPAANLDPNSAAAAFAIAAVAAAAAQSNPKSSVSAAKPTFPTSTLPYYQNMNKPKSSEAAVIQANKRQRLSSPEPSTPIQKEQVAVAGESLLTSSWQLETSYPSLRGHTLTITQPSNANSKFKINILNENVIATKLEGINVQTGAKTALYRCHICGKIVGFLSKLQSHLSLHYDRSNPVQMFACYICDEKFQYRQDLVDHVMNHQNNQNEIEQPPPLLVSPAARESLSKEAATPDQFSHMIPSPPPLLQFPYQRPGMEEAHEVNSPTATSQSSPESINQLSPRGLTSAVAQVQPLLPSSNGMTTPIQTPTPQPALIPLSSEPYPSNSPSSSGSGYPKKCRFCDKVFEKGYSLQRHERIHTGFKPCYCEECGRGFSEPRNLRHHILRYHSDDAAKQLEMLRRAHRSRNGTLPFGTNKEQQLALMQHKTKENPKRQFQPPTPGSFVQENKRPILEAIPTSSSSSNPSPAPSNENQIVMDLQDLSQRGEDQEEIQMEEDDRRSHMELVAENNPIDDDEEEEVYVDDDCKRDKTSEIAKLAQAFLNSEDLQEMGVSDEKEMEQDIKKDHRSPTPASPCPENYAVQPSNSLVIKEQETKEISSPPSPAGDEGSITSSCSKRSLAIPEAEALSPTDPLRHSAYEEDVAFDDATSETDEADGAVLDYGSEQNNDPKSRILSKTNPRLAVVEPGIDRTSICKPRYVNGKAIYSCVFCDKEFCSYSDINRHLNFHEDLRPFKCKYCEYQSRTNSQLKVHMMRHQGIREFGCRICNYSGVTQSDVNRHKKSQQHLLKSQNVCEICGLGFFKPVLLQQHQISEHQNGGLIRNSYDHLEVEIPTQ